MLAQPQIKDETQIKFKKGWRDVRDVLDETKKRTVTVNGMLNGKR